MVSLGHNELSTIIGTGPSRGFIGSAYNHDYNNDDDGNDYDNSNATNNEHLLNTTV